MKTTRAFRPHLVFNEALLPSGGEWAPESGAWAVLAVVRGTAYWMNRGAAIELLPGGVLVLSPRVQGAMHASRLAEVCIRFFYVFPGRLTGLFSLADLEWFDRAAANEGQGFKLVVPDHPVAARMAAVAEQSPLQSVSQRLVLLQLFTEALDTGFRLEEMSRNGDSGEVGGRHRLREFLGRSPEADLLDLSFSELAQRTGCAPRHLSRLFHEIVGLSFRAKQTELRLTRARELLASSRAKVIDIALESGYGSLSRFNLLFKKHFGVSPGRWRQDLIARKSRRVSARRRHPALEILTNE